MINLSVDEKLNILIEAGELIRIRDDFFEDMGGHLVFGPDCAGFYFEYYFKSLSDNEKEDLLKTYGES